LSIFQALVLGITQGLAEFIPISSSGHLVLIPWLFQWQDPGLTFDVALHAGTLLALVVYFRRDLVELVIAFVLGLQKRSFADPQAKLAGLLIIATVPGIIAGALLEQPAQTGFRAAWLVAIMLMALGVTLFAAEMFGKRYKDIEQMSLWDVVLVGVAQAFAIIPGVSRSGATITMGLFRGIKRSSAARFSFLLGIPITAGAAAKHIYEVARMGIPADEQAAFAVGVVSAAVVGFLAIAFLLRYLQRNSTLVFVAYRLVLGIAVLALALGRGS